MADIPSRRSGRSLWHPPLWARWVMTIVAFAVVIAAVAVVARSGGASRGGQSSSEEALAVAEANKEGRTAIAEDQAPHVAALRSGAPPAVALERAIASDVHARIRGGQLTGPLQSVRCRSAGRSHVARLPFHCAVRSAGIGYPFLAVVDETALQLTWCKVDPPPVANASLAVAVSARCR
jgi:hypothetical protein